MMETAHLPGGELIAAGLDDLRRGLETFWTGALSSGLFSLLHPNLGMFRFSQLTISANPPGPMRATQASAGASTRLAAHLLVILAVACSGGTEPPDGSVVTTDGFGLVTGVAPGTATVEATAENVTATLEITTTP
jgi:hypothetical protein